MTEVTALIDKNCLICHHELRFAIQKDIDEGFDISDIATKYTVRSSDVKKHNERGHREGLIAFGTADYIMRKKAIDVGTNLVDFIQKWAENIKNRHPDKIKDADAIRAIELYMKSRGDFVDKHEVTIKRSIEEALGSFLGEEKSEDIIEVKATEEPKKEE